MDLNSNNNIPIFPKFKNLTIEDKEEIENITKKMPPYSDYNFASLWSYNVKNDIVISKLYQNLVVRFRDYISHQQFYSFLGRNKVKKTIDALLNHAKRENVLSKLKLIPEDNILDNPKLSNFFQITQDRDHFDYVFLTEELSKLEGSKFTKKRNKLSNFLKKNPHIYLNLVDLMDPKNHKDIISLFLTWGNNKAKHQKDTDNELIALKRLLEHAKFLDLYCLGIFTNSKQLIGFSITELLQQKYSILHFTKADSSYVGIFEFIYKSTAEELYRKKYEYINREQDLGIPGLRESKISWRPIKFLKKYIISPKDKV